MKILYLEDSPFDADLTRRGLAGADPGFELEIVGTLAEAYARLEDVEAALKRGDPPRYDLALLDMHLPDGSGLSALARVRDRSLPLAVVVLTGAGDEEAVMSALRMGADDYLTKRLEYWTLLPDALILALGNFRTRTALISRPIRLLYVEPNPSDVELLSLHLAQHAPFIRLETIEMPAQALARLPLKGPVSDVDVILLDFRLPGMDALELLKEIRLVRKLDVPILINSGQGTEEIAIRAVKLGAMDYLEKSPGYLQRLPLAVESAYYRSQARRERNALRETEVRLRTIIETEPECVKLVGPGGDLLEMNAAGLAMLEAGSLEEVRQWKLIEYILPEYRPQFRELHQRVMAGETGLIEFEILGLKGTRRWMETHAAPMRDADGKIESLLGITRDITKRRRDEEQLRQHEKLSAIGQLAGGIAHDFNNQLAAILGYAELLGTRIEDSELKRYIDTIIRATKRSGDLTRNLLAFSRQGHYLNIPVDIHRLIHETVELLGRSIDKRISVRLRLEADHATIIGDPSQIQNALLNLGLNARDAMSEGGTLEFATEVVDVDALNRIPDPCLKEDSRHDLSPGRYLHVRVSDTGCGMAKEVKKRLFEPFFTTKPVGKGTGMGLASVYGTVSLHHGSISVDSEVGRGTTFHIHLPLSEAHADEGGRGAELPKMRKLRVLVVDDEEMLRAVIADMLGSEGHSVHKAVSGREALSIYQGNWMDIDLIILDVTMPDMDGWETLREIRIINPAAKVVLTSGFKPIDETNWVQKHGALGFLSKPFERAQLDAVVARAIGLIPVFSR